MHLYEVNITFNVNFRNLFDIFNKLNNSLSTTELYSETKTDTNFLIKLRHIYINNLKLFVKLLPDSNVRKWFVNVVRSSVSSCESFVLNTRRSAVFF